MISPPQSKIVILGNTGFIGKALFDHVQEYSRVPVLGFSSSAIDLRLPESVNLIEKVIDDQTILFIVSGVTLDRATDTLETFTVNAEMVVNVGRALQKRRVRKCVYLSSVSVYGDMATNLFINEQTPIEPVTYYATAKYAGECLLRKVAESAGFPLLILRLCRVYGPSLIHANYGPMQFIRSILHEGCVNLYGEGKELRDHLYIEDLVRIVTHLSLGNFCGVYNVATGKSHTFLEVISCLEKIAPQKFCIFHLPRTRPLIDQQFDIRKLINAIPNLRFTEFEEGLASTYEYSVKSRCFI